MDTSSSAFLRLWRNENIRSKVISNLDVSSVCSIRLTTAECSALVTPTLFARTHLTFTPSCLTRQSRWGALSRIGQYIEHLTFSMPHNNSTFLPPLLNPFDGQEITFLYNPYTSTASEIQRPRYGSPELGDLLTQQYPPIFHAATNVTSFINALKQMPNLRHLTVSCPGQDPAQRYRRDAVDYALISLRIAVERSPLLRLEKLSLNRIHPAGLVYFRHMAGYGCIPSASRRWRQVRKLCIVMDSWDFHGAQPGLDHLKIIDEYVRGFSAQLEKVSFGWNGKKGPCPFALFSDPLFAPTKKTTKLFAEVTSPMSPLPAPPTRSTMVFPELRYLQVRNASMNVKQVAEIAEKHRDKVQEFDFENVFLTDNGLWEDALAPLTRTGGREEWSSQQSGSEIESFKQTVLEEAEEVIDTIQEPRCSISVTKLKRKRHRKRKRKHRDKTPKDLIVSEPLAIAATGEMLQPVIFDPNISGVQRNHVQEAVQKELAEDPELRVSVLKKAKEAVLRQLGKEFCNSRDRKEPAKGLVVQNRCSPKTSTRVMLARESSTALVPLMFSRC